MRHRVVLAVILSLSIATDVLAAGPEWVAYDPDYPLLFVDVASISMTGESSVQYWMRGGKRGPSKGAVKGPIYILYEVDCAKRLSRQVKVDAAVEDMRTPEGMLWRAEFLEKYAGMYEPLPSPWEALEPTKHEYLLTDLVCKPLKAKQTR